jgi:hypothetical protein
MLTIMLGASRACGTEVTNSGSLQAHDKDMLSGTHDGREREGLKTYDKMTWQCPFYTKA